MLSFSANVMHLSTYIADNWAHLSSNNKKKKKSKSLLILLEMQKWQIIAFSFSIVIWLHRLIETLEYLLIRWQWIFRDETKADNNIIPEIRATHSLGPARACFVSLLPRFAGDGAAVEVGALVLLVHPDQSAHVRVGRGGFLQRSVLLLERHLRLQVLLLPGQEAVPNLAVSQGDGAVPAAQLGGWVLAVPPGQERAHTSGGAAATRIRGGGVLAQARFGTDAGHHSRFIGPGLGARFGCWADPVGAVPQVDGEVFEPLCHSSSGWDPRTSLQCAAPSCAMHQGHQGPRGRTFGKSQPLLTKDFRCFSPLSSEPTPLTPLQNEFLQRKEKSQIARFTIGERKKEKKSH